MIIDRSPLLSNLYNFSLEDSGIVYGKPGIGKSFLVRQLKAKLLESNILCFVIQIDYVIDYSDQAITTELGLPDNWIDTFKKIKIGNHKAVLIFDAFDAARDESLRNGYLGQVRRAKRELGDKWNILVTVRTYDAAKSPELMQLFTNGKIGNGRPIVRRFEVPDLTDDEVEQVTSKGAKFAMLYAQAGKQLKVILHNPFFLEILDGIVYEASETEINEIKLFKSESQLLSIFWAKKILSGSNHIAKELFLSSFSHQLVEHQTLNYNKLEVFKAIASDALKAFDDLRSENIIDEVSVNQSRLAYAHNILFDYAVSRLCISDDYTKFSSFLEADLTRPFFLRASFVYFFTDLWYQERDIFWNFYFKLLASNQKEIQLFIRLVLNGIIAADFNEPEELSRLILSDGEILPSSMLIRQLLQSIRFVRRQSSSADVALLLHLSRKLAIDYIFEFGFLLDRMISESELSVADHSLAGETARNFLNYILEERKANKNAYLDRIGSQRGVEMVAKTYDTNIAASRALLERVMTIIAEPGFDITYFVNLAEDVKYILPCDAEMVGSIYNVIFGYNETSTEPTEMGASVVMRLLGNRKQDFEMCYYRLQKFFPEFIITAPEVAIKTGLGVVNKFISEDRNEGLTEPIISFQVGERQYKFQADYSAIWGDNTWGKPSEIAQAIIAYFKELSKEGNEQELRKLIELYKENAMCAFTWKSLLQFYLGDKYTSAKEIFDFISNGLLLKHTDTSFEIRELIEKFSPEFTNEQIAFVEGLVFEVYDAAKGNMVERVLSRLPSGRLQTEKAKNYMDSHEIIKNEPPFSSSGFTSSPYTTDDWLRDQGVDLEKPNNKDVSGLSNQLQRYNSQWLNDTPSLDDYQDLLPLARNLRNSLVHSKVKLPADLYQTALSELGKFAAIVSRDFHNLKKEVYEFILELTEISFAYKTKSDEEVENPKDVHFSYSSTPRNSAAEALSNLYCYDQSPENLFRLIEGLNDNNHIVRFITVRNLKFVYNVNYDLYKKLIVERLEKETNGFIYSVLLANIVFKKELVAKEAPDVFKIIQKKAAKFAEYESFVTNYTELLLYFMHDFDVDIAYEILFNAYGKERLCNTVIFRLFEAMHPAMVENDFVNSPHEFERDINIIKNYITQAHQSLVQFDKESLNMENPVVKKALLTLDKIIQRIYFVLQPKSYGRNPSFDLPIPDENKRAFYFTIKPILLDIIDVSGTVTEQGLIIGHTAHYFIQTLNEVLPLDPRDILAMVTKITQYSIQGGYTFDSMAVQEIVALTEKLLADHRNLLLESDAFNNLLILLDIYINSGWVNALDLLWRLDEIFR